MKTFATILVCVLVCSTAFGVSPISKCTVSAGKGLASDSITISGILSATEADFMAASEVSIEINCDTIVLPLSVDFDINELTFKRGKFKSVVKDVTSTYSFSFDTKTGKFSFSAKKVDLTGLSCPFTLSILIDTFSADILLEEPLVNGPKKPCPAQLMMGVADSLTIDKIKMSCGRTPGTDLLTVSGFFTIAGNYDKSNPFCVTSGTQTFTIPGNQFINKNSVETCSNGQTADGPVISSKLDFDKCTFVVSIKNAVIEDTGDVDFIMDCFGHALSSQISLSDSSPRYDLERYRCYDVLGRDWTYSADYRVIIDAPDDLDMDSYETGSTTGSVSVENYLTHIDGHQCNTVSVSSSDSTMYSQWYEDYYGTHQYSWGNLSSDLMGFEADMDFLMVVPKLMPVGQTFKNSGPFSGDFNLGIGSGLDIYDFKGKAAVSTTLLGFESVTVPYNGNTTFDNAAKVQINLTLNGSMVFYIEMYDMSIRTKFQATMNQTWYGVEDLGAVKCNSDMTMKLTIVGESIKVNLTEEDVLTGYNP